MYFSLNIGAAEREMEATAVVIRSVFCVFNPQGVGFVDSSGKPTVVPDPDNRSAGLTYFTFRSVVNAADINNRIPDKPLFFEFSICLPQTFRILPPSPGLQTTQTAATSFASDKSTTAVSTPTRSVSQLSFELGSYMDDALNNLEPTVIVKLLADARLARTHKKLQPLVSAKLFSTPAHTSIMTPISGLTPKMNRGRSVNSTTSVTTFMGPLDFLDSQLNFDNIFGSRRTIFCLSKRCKTSCTTEDKEYLAARLLNFFSHVKSIFFVMQSNCNM